VITPDIADFIGRQHMFFVATAPLTADGHVNLSPKGHDTLRVLDESTVCYLDLTGSGVETIAHLHENGRITIMLCAFEGNPNIVRLYGTGEAVLPDDERFAELAGRFAEMPGTRAVILVHVSKVTSSCGYAVPSYVYDGDRNRLHEWADARGPDGLVAYRASKNAESIDGLPGLP
jgi:hypothetical protein